MTPRQFVTFALSGVNPAPSSAGNVSSEPAPAMVLTVPATSPAPARKPASVRSTYDRPSPVRKSAAPTLLGKHTLPVPRPGGRRGRDLHFPSAESAAEAVGM